MDLVVVQVFPVQVGLLVLLELPVQAAQADQVELLVQAELLVRLEYLQVKYITLMKVIIVMSLVIKYYQPCQMGLSKQ
jgi:hypothetical protein